MNLKRGKMHQDMGLDRKKWNLICSRSAAALRLNMTFDLPKEECFSSWINSVSNFIADVVIN